MTFSTFFSALQKILTNFLKKAEEFWQKETPLEIQFLSAEGFKSVRIHKQLVSVYGEGVISESMDVDQC